MTFVPTMRAITGPTRPENKQAIDQLVVAVRELSGTLGPKMQRAVRVGELIDAGILEFKTDGSIGPPGDGKSSLIDQNILLTGNQRRIRGDLTSTTPIVNRLLVQSSVLNGASNLGVIPNGTANVAVFSAWNSSDPDNAGTLQLRMEPALAVLNSSSTGTGVTRDISIQHDGIEAARFYTDKHFAVQSYIDSMGAVAGFRAWDRTDTANVNKAWVQYADGNIWRLYDGAVDVLQYNRGTKAFVLAQPASRIQGDFFGATFLNRTAFQDATLNNGTLVSVIPNGTGATAGIDLWSGSSMNNCHRMMVRVDATAASIYINGVGTGSTRDLAFLFNSAEKHRIDTNGCSWVANAGTSTMTRQPRVFVQSADPGSAAIDNDLWAWSGGLKRRLSGAWTVV